MHWLSFILKTAYEVQGDLCSSSDGNCHRVILAILWQQERALSQHVCYEAYSTSRQGLGVEGLGKVWGLVNVGD